MRGAAGFWIAITLLALLTAAFAGLYFSQQTSLQEAKDYVVNATAQDLANETADRKANQNVKKLITEQNDLREALKARDDLIGKGKKMLKDVESERDDKDEQRKQAARKVIDLQDEVKRMEDVVAKARQEKTEIRASIDEKQQEELNRALDNYQKAQSRLEELTRKLTRQQEREQAMREAFLLRIRELQRENVALRGVVDNVQAKTGKREAYQEEPYDGKLIQVDVDNKFVVINLGREQRVRRGMRFDVIRWRLNKWDLIGAIQVTAVDATTSQGVILDEIVEKKVCPITGYVARDPEEIVSPYVVGSNERAIRLVEMGVEERPAMSKLDPMVTGDFISNPFFSKERELKFVVTGDMICGYSPEQIRQRIKEDGGLIQDKVDVDTDYLVLGRLPDEAAAAASAEGAKAMAEAKEALETAKQYGIPVMRGVELLKFLRK